MITNHTIDYLKEMEAALGVPARPITAKLATSLVRAFYTHARKQPILRDEFEGALRGSQSLLIEFAMLKFPNGHFLIRGPTKGEWHIDFSFDTWITHGVGEGIWSGCISCIIKALILVEE